MAVCRAPCLARSDSLDVRMATETLIKYSNVTREVLKATTNGLIDLATGLQKLPSPKDVADDKEASEKERASAKVIKSVEDTYDCARSYIVMSYRLAGYIKQEEEPTIASVKRGKVEKFKAFVDTLLTRSVTCQHGLSVLISHIENTEKPLLDEYQALVEKSDKSAKNKAIGGTAGIVGGGGAIAAGLSAAGTATAVTFATSLGPQAPFTVPIGITVAVTSFLFVAAGGTAIGAAVGSGVLITYYKKKRAAYKELIDTLKDMKESLQRIEVSLTDIHQQLQLMIINNLEGMTNRIFKRIELRSSIPNTIQTIAVQARHMREYCQPIVDAVELKEFSKNGHTKQS